jgi:hypothetical protein
MQLLLLAGVFFGTLLAILAVYNLVNRRELQAADTARAMLRRGINPGAADHGGILRDQRTSDIPFLDRCWPGASSRRVSPPSWSARGRSGAWASSCSPASPGRSLGSWSAQRLGGPVYALVAAVGGGLVPTFLLTRAKRKRIGRFETQLPRGSTCS